MNGDGPDRDGGAGAGTTGDAVSGDSGAGAVATMMPVIITAGGTESLNQGYYGAPKADLITGLQVLLQRGGLRIAAGEEAYWRFRGWRGGGEAEPATNVGARNATLLPHSKTGMFDQFRENRGSNSAMRFQGRCFPWKEGPRLAFRSSAGGSPPLCRMRYVCSEGVLPVEGF